MRRFATQVKTLHPGAVTVNSWWLRQSIGRGCGDRGWRPRSLHRYCCSSRPCSRPRIATRRRPSARSRALPARRRRRYPIASIRSRRAGEDLYHELLQPARADCHGKRGEGNGPLASQFDPRPRNFACAQTVNGIPDGQLHWIIKNGSPATAMPSFGFLGDEEIWQLVIYLRSLANGH